MTQWYRFDRMPETYSDVHYTRDLNHEFSERASVTKQASNPFFCYLLTTVPAGMGQSAGKKELDSNKADEVAYTILRMIALRYIKTNRKCS